MTMLERKLLRDLRALKSQALTIALVVAAGLGAFIAQLSTYDSLQWLRQAYYDTSRFAVEYLITVQFYALERAHVTVTFTDPVNDRARAEIAHLPGVLRTEVSRSVPVRLRAGHYTYRTAVIGLPEHAELRRLLDAALREVPLPPDGLLLTDRLAQRLNVHAGDTVTLTALEGTRVTREVRVVGLVRELVGLSAYMDLEALNRLMGEGRTISAVAVTVDAAQAHDFYRQLKAMPKVATVSIKSAAIKTFEETSARNILVFTTIVTVFAAAMTVGVVYNSARIALAERGWELASLRVLGFTRHEVSVLLLGELALEIAAANPTQSRRSRDPGDARSHHCPERSHSPGRAGRARTHRACGGRRGDPEAGDCRGRPGPGHTGSGPG
jgi:ABC-type lipoprotein release transport system permease subunit